MTTTANYRQILNCPHKNDNGTSTTVGEYLCKLLTKLLTDAEGFDGKKPYGNSGWELEILESLNEYGYLYAQSGSDDYGSVEFTSAEKAEGFKLIKDAIVELFEANKKLYADEVAQEIKDIEEFAAELGLIPYN